MKQYDLKKDIRKIVVDIGSGLATEKSFVSSKYDIFENLYHNGIMYYLSLEDITMLSELSTNAKFAGGSIDERLFLYDTILNRRGFIRSTTGTNRMVYTASFDDSMVLKIGLDKVGCKDNIGEFRNQYVLKPYVPKTFDVTKNGIVALVERVRPFKTREEFYELGGGKVYDIIKYFYDHGFVMEDVGTNFFKNWGERKNFGAVLLDYPYIYRINKDRLVCNKFINKKPCNGPIIYDDGINYLYCTKCGARYAAKDIGTPFHVVNEVRIQKESKTMRNRTPRVVIVKNGKEYSQSPSSDIISSFGGSFIDRLDDSFFDKKNRVMLVKHKTPTIDGQEITISHFERPSEEDIKAMDAIESSKVEEKPVEEKKSVNIRMSVDKPRTKVFGGNRERKPFVKKELSFRGKFLTSEWKKLMGELSSNYHFDTRDDNEEMKDFIQDYLRDHMSDFIDINVMIMKNDTLNMTSEERKQFDADIREEFAKTDHYGNYNCIGTPWDLFIVSKGAPRIDEGEFLKTYRKAVEAYFEESNDAKEDLKAVDNLINTALESTVKEPSKEEEPVKEDEVIIPPVPEEKMENGVLTANPSPEKPRIILHGSSPIAEGTIKEEDAVDIEAVQEF